MAFGCLLSRTDCPWFTLFPYPFSLNHPEVFQGLLDCLFFIRRALGLFSVLRLRLIVVLTLDDTTFLLYLCDIQAAYFQAAMLQHIILDLLIGSFLLRICQIKLVHAQINLDMLFGVKFGQ